MAQYRLGHETTKHRRQTNVVIPVSVKTQVYTRLKAMRDSLQEELGPDQYVTLASNSAQNSPPTSRIAQSGHATFCTGGRWGRQYGTVRASRARDHIFGGCARVAGARGGTWGPRPLPRPVPSPLGVANGPLEAWQAWARPGVRADPDRGSWTTL